MFKIDDEVRVRSNGAKGVVSYIEDGYICVDMDNGVEMDFTDVAQLQLVSEYESEQTINIPTHNGPPGYDVKTHTLDLSYVPRKGDRRLAATAMDMVKKIFPMVLDGMRSNHEGYDDLDSFDQVKVLSQVTGTPMIVFMGAAQMNDESMMLEVLRQTMVNNVLGGGDLVSDMLLGKAKRVIAEYEAEIPSIEFALDTIDATPPVIQAAAYQLVKDRIIREHPLPDDDDVDISKEKE